MAASGSLIVLGAVPLCNTTAIYMMSCGKFTLLFSLCIAGGVGAILALTTIICSMPSIIFHISGKKRKILTNQADEFEWHTTKAVQAFNERAKTFNYLLERHRLGMANENTAEKLEHFHEVLSRARKSLKRAIKISKCLKNGKDIYKLLSKPQIASSLAELAQAECNLIEYATGANNNLPAAERILENETELNRLLNEDTPALLPEKT